MKKLFEWFDDWMYDGISGFPNWKGDLFIALLIGLIAYLVCFTHLVIK